MKDWWHHVCQWHVAMLDSRVVTLNVMHPQIVLPMVILHQEPQHAVRWDAQMRYPYWNSDDVCSYGIKTQTASWTDNCSSLSTCSLTLACMAADPSLGSVKWDWGVYKCPLSDLDGNPERTVVNKCWDRRCEFNGGWSIHGTIRPVKSTDTHKCWEQIRQEKGTSAYSGRAGDRQQPGKYSHPRGIILHIRMVDVR